MLQGDARVQQSIGISEEAGKVFKEKKYEEAAELFALAAQIEDTEYSFYENAAISYNLAGQYDKASYYFDKVITIYSILYRLSSYFNMSILSY